MSINRKIGNKIKEARLEKRLSREQIARRLGVRQQTIEKYEKGIVEISVVKLGQIANILNVGITYLLPDQEAFKYYVKKQIEITNLPK